MKHFPTCIEHSVLFELCYEETMFNLRPTVNGGPHESSDHVRLADADTHRRRLSVSPKQPAGSI